MAQAAGLQQGGLHQTILGYTDWPRTQCSSQTRAMAHAALGAFSRTSSFRLSRRTSASLREISPSLCLGCHDRGGAQRQEPGVPRARFFGGGMQIQNTWKKETKKTQVREGSSGCNGKFSFGFRRLRVRLLSSSHDCPAFLRALTALATWTSLTHLGPSDTQATRPTTSTSRTSLTTLATTATASLTTQGLASRRPPAPRSRRAARGVSLACGRPRSKSSWRRRAGSRRRGVRARFPHTRPTCSAAKRKPCRRRLTRAAGVNGAGARAAADLERVARAAGLHGLCDALAFTGLAAELPALCEVVGHPSRRLDLRPRGPPHRPPPTPPHPPGGRHRPRAELAVNSVSSHL